MFRLIRLSVFLCLVFLVVVGAYLWVARVPTLERALSRQLGCKVEIDEVEVGWNQLSIYNLKIQNPPRSSTIPYAFYTERLTIEAPLSTLWSSNKRIKRILMSKSVMEIELFNLAGNENNWAHILSHLPHTERPHFRIDHIVVSNLQFKALREKGKQLPTITLPYLELSNLGSQFPLTPSQVSHILFEAMLSSVTSKSYLSGVLDSIGRIPPQLLQGISSTLPHDEEKNLLQESFQTLKRKTQDAAKFLQGLFS